MSQKIFGSLMIVLLIAACAPATPVPVPTPTLAPLFSEKVDVGGYKLQILCSGQGTPTVIVDGDFADPVLESGNWLSVRYGIEKSTRICIYDRADLGSSDTAPTQPRTSQDIVKDLHTLLVNANIPGPYVLVGHHFGGFNVRLYASQYSEEVVGMVLVDALHPDYEDETLAVLPPESPDDPDSVKYMRKYGFLPASFGNLESIDFNSSSAQVRAADPLGDLPLVVLTSGPVWLGYPDHSPEVKEKIEKVWQDLQIDLTKLSSNSAHVLTTKVDAHFSIPVNEPQLVIDAILKVVNEAKK